MMRVKILDRTEKADRAGGRMQARKPGTCKRCWQAIQIGQGLVSVPGPRGKCYWVHDGCEAKAGTQSDWDADRVREAVRPVIREEAREAVREELVSSGCLKRVLEVRVGTAPTREIEGTTPVGFERVLRLAAARRNILLIGPAGSGKTHTAELVAQALGLDFAFIPCSAGMSEGQLLGRLLPTGAAGQFVYARSDFVRCYEEGGVFLFDEIDAADPNTLLVINAALANGKMAVPNRVENPVAIRHPDFVCIAAANTFGTGADRQYVGRNQLDESTLDRFRIGQVVMDYSPELEVALCPDKQLRTRLQHYRERIRQCKLRRVVSTRFLRDAYLMTQAGDTDADIDGALFSGWGPDEVAKVRGEF